MATDGGGATEDLSGRCLWRVRGVDLRRDRRERGASLTGERERGGCRSPELQLARPSSGRWSSPHADLRKEGREEDLEGSGEEAAATIGNNRRRERR